MLVYILSFIILLLVGLLGFLCWKIYVLLELMAVFENDLSDNIAALDNVDNSLEGIIQLKMFFDSKDIQILLKEVMDNIKLAKLQVGKTSKRFTDRSKHKYYLIEEVNEFEETSQETSDLFVPVNKR